MPEAEYNKITSINKNIKVDCESSLSRVLYCFFGSRDRLHLDARGLGRYLGGAAWAFFGLFAGKFMGRISR